MAGEGAAPEGQHFSELLERAPELWFRGLLDAAPDAMVIVGADGRIQLVNAQVERLFGYRREEILGEPVDILVPQAVRDLHPQHRTNYFRDPRVRPMGAGLDLRGRRKDGTEFPAEISLAPMRTSGGVLVTAAIRDVTERRRLEQKMQEALRLKSEFLANMSHELRTPLNAIIGFADLMHRGKVGPVAPDHHEYLGDILTSARHLLQLINDVLDLAKVESGKMEFRPAAIDMAKLTGEVRDILRGLAAGKRLQLEIDVEPSVREVVADPGRLKQVLYNYLSNAIKFTPEGGRIAIRVTPEGPELFRLSVEDTGIGISTEQLQDLFIEFQQLDASSSKRYAGTGLGLALTKRIVEAHGGRVEVRSEVGVGSTFSAILPRRTYHPAPEGEGDAEAHATGARADARQTVLLVDDDPASAKSLEAHASDLGCRFMWTRNVTEALTVARRDPPGVVVIDPAVTEAAMVGTFLAQFAEVVGGRDVPVVIWTAQDPGLDQQARLRRLTAAYCSKAAGTPVHLVETLRVLLRRPAEAGHGG